jgi:hypothetical protein
MSKKAGKSSKKRLILLSGLILVVLMLAAGAAWFFLRQQEAQQKADTTRQEAVTKVRTELDDVAFRGNKEVAAAYIERVRADDLEGALKVYEQAAASLDTNGKILLYRSAYTAAAQAEQTEHTLKFLLKLAELEPGYRIYGALADNYALRKDVVHEVEYRQKAVDAINALPHDSDVYTSLLSLYQDQLKHAQEKQ